MGVGKRGGGGGRGEGSKLKQGEKNGDTSNTESC